MKFSFPTHKPLHAILYYAGLRSFNINWVANALQVFLSFKFMYLYKEDHYGFRLTCFKIE